jgi:hypothetical protein
MGVHGRQKPAENLLSLNRVARRVAEPLNNNFGVRDPVVDQVGIWAGTKAANARTSGGPTGVRVIPQVHQDSFQPVAYPLGALR